jgi:hypothetical protein
MRTYVSNENLGQQLTQQSLGGANTVASKNKQHQAQSLEGDLQKRMVTEYIIDRIETINYDKLSPRSKEVYMIVQLIKNCFAKYNKAPKT